MPPKSKRTSLRSRAAVSSASSKPSQSDSRTIASESSPRLQANTSGTTFKQKDLLGRIRDGGIRKKVLKRRRPGKKLKATEDVSGLRDALPDVPSLADEDGGDGDEWEGISNVSDAAMEGTDNTSAIGMRKATRRRRKKDEAVDGKMVMKTLKHRPGAMKRKRLMEERERQRFGKNLAQMVGSISGAVDRPDSGGTEGGSGGVGKGVSSAEKWAALRRFIGGTMTKDAAFNGNVRVGAG